MQALRQIGGGLIIAIASVVLVVGGISLAFAESAPPVVQQENPIIALPTLPPVFPTLTIQAQNNATLDASLPPAFTQNVVFTETATLAIAATFPPPVVCTPPSGWFQIVVGLNETIYTLSQRYNTSEDALKNANCLPTSEIQAGNLLYVPPVAPAPPIVCGPPSTWVKAHVVQPLENLYRISLLYRTTVPQLQSANCMGSSITIYVGQLLWVPNVPTSTPVPGVTIIPTFPTSTASFTPVPPTFTLTLWHTATTTQTFIVTSSPIPTSSPVPSSTNTPVPAITLTPSITPFPNP